ncbi:hypothetical protein QJQ45_021596 [Haematococcus lacustris]|nr:hypothetical protein QJQ45_021596 [Haematococcus lacustris]
MDHREQRAQVRLATLSGHVASTSAAPGRMLEGKTAIITGAGKGIGEAAALEMAAHGAAVVVCDLDGPAASSVVQRIQAAGGRAVAVQADVTSEDAPARIVEAAVKAFGGLDILVNNAGFTWDGVIQKMTPTQWEMMLKVHCTAPFRLIQAATPYMRDAGRCCPGRHTPHAPFTWSTPCSYPQAETDVAISRLKQRVVGLGANGITDQMAVGGKAEAAGGGSPKPRSIVNISSTTGTHGNAGQANYATAKAGIIGLTKSVAKEWGPFGVRCNALAFGLIDTRLTRPKEGGEAIEVDGQKVALGIPGADSYWKSVMSQVPLRRAGSAEEAAGAIMMLVCPWAAYVTGQVRILLGCLLLPPAELANLQPEIRQLAASSSQNDDDWVRVVQAALGECSGQLDLQPQLTGPRASEAMQKTVRELWAALQHTQTPPDFRPLQEPLLHPCVCPPALHTHCRAGPLEHGLFQPRAVPQASAALLALDPDNLMAPFTNNGAEAQGGAGPRQDKVAASSQARRGVGSTSASTPSSMFRPSAPTQHHHHHHHHHHPQAKAPPGPGQAVTQTQSLSSQPQAPGTGSDLLERSYPGLQPGHTLPGALTAAATAPAPGLMGLSRPAAGDSPSLGPGGAEQLRSREQEHGMQRPTPSHDALKHQHRSHRRHNQQWRQHEESDEEQLVEAG